MRKCMPLILTLALTLGSLGNALAARPQDDGDLDNVRANIGYELVAPDTALISPTGAYLTVRQKVPVAKYRGHTIVDFVLPPDSGNLQLSAPGHSIVRWSSSPAIISATSDASSRRARIEKELAQLNGRLTMINARLALWQALPKSGGVDEINALQKAMEAEMPQLAMEQAELERRLKITNDELSRMPQPSSLGERIRVILAEDLPEGQLVEIEYRYTHDGCGWDAIYNFNAIPSGNGDDIIAVRLLAEVWQFTGLDWQNTRITLSTRGSGPREPAPLQEWIIDSQRQPLQPRAVLKAAAPALLSETENAAPSTQTSQIAPDTSSIYATWQLPASGLPQGRVRLEITSDQWKAPLEWLARPTRDNGNVWLMANYRLPVDKVWPVGQAEFSVRGQSVGSGIFRPRAGAATIYFGADPSVNVQTIANSRQRGESGFISAQKTFTWAWTYIISNGHEKPIRVKVERPAPMVVDGGITVNNKNRPEAQIDQDKHMYVWDVEVPARGNSSIEHAVTISTSGRLPLLPDMP